MNMLWPLAFIAVYYATIGMIFQMRWAVLVSRTKRPDILNKRHTDFIWPFKRMPRSWTALLSDVRPIKLLGTADRFGHLDITAPGTWAFTFPFFFTVRFRKTRQVFGRKFDHFRIGDRYDYNDHYYRPFSFTVKEVR